MVQIEWSVVPVVIEDRYEIKITQTFETNVPAPVLITEPAAMNLPLLQPGQVFNGEFTVTNYGYIEVYDVKIEFPTTFDDYDVEVYTSVIPTTIGAMQKITVPYRIARRSLLASTQFSVPSTQYCGTDSPIHLFTNSPSLFDEVRGYGGGTCLAAITMKTKGTAIICPNTPQQRTVEKETICVIGYTKTDCPTEAGGGGVYTPPGGGGGGTYTAPPPVQSGGGQMPGFRFVELIIQNNPCNCKVDGTPCGEVTECWKYVCKGGICEKEYEPAGKQCSDDGNPCTYDKCDGYGFCTHEKKPNGPCDNPDGCCYNGEWIQNYPIIDLDKCPNRQPHGWYYEYDGCTIVPQNPGMGSFTSFTDETNRTGPCDLHDKCYQTCWPGDAVGARYFCDAEFLVNALERCGNAMFVEPVNAVACVLAAETYYAGLSAIGWWVFNERQKQVCNCCK